MNQNLKYWISGLTSLVLLIHFSSVISFVVPIIVVDVVDGFSSPQECCRLRRLHNYNNIVLLHAQLQSEESSTKNVTLVQDNVHVEQQHQRLRVVRQFVSTVKESIESGTLLSLTIRGVNKPKKKKKQSSSNNKDDANDAESLRGSIRQIQGRLIQLSRKDNVRDDIDSNRDLLLQLTIKYHLATDIVKNIELTDIDQVLTNLIVDPKVASEWGVQAVQSHNMKGATLETTENVFELLLVDNKEASIRKHKADKTTQSIASQYTTQHDRVKHVPISNDADFLQLLGVTNSDGKPRPGMKSKLRQCQKFVEIVGNLVEKAGNSSQCISVLDMGCGRGYLTFALHSYLTQKYDKTPVTSLGIDVRPKLIQEITDIAYALGDNFQSLKFEEGTIEIIANEAALVDSAESNDNNRSSLDILVALHACDTATDDALFSAVARGANVIVVAPCCHKEIRTQLDHHMIPQNDPVLRHSIYRERFAETVTDSLRALLLEFAGYQTNVFEFIGGEHTSKNVMITAVKARRRRAAKEVINEEIVSLANAYGIRYQKLAYLMGVQLVDGKSDQPSADILNKSKLVRHRMPPVQKPQ